MKTELTEIKRQLKIYRFSNNQKHIDNAIIYLNKVHKKYGTIEISQIKNIIR